jgi:hypothetical protein
MIGFGLGAIAGTLLAQATPTPTPAPPPPPPADAQPPAPPAPTAEDLQKLADQDQALRDDVDALKDQVDDLQKQVTALSALKARVSGYLDVGWFYVGGNGSGLRTDAAAIYYPEYAYAAPWIFLGDPLSVAINSRGEPATTGPSRAVRLNSIDSQSSFLVNTAALDMFAGIHDDLSVTTFVDFLPRGRDVDDPNGLFLGDYLDVKLAYVEWQPHLEHTALALQAGKFDSVVGYEYRIQEAPDRTTVTPSLLCRYVCGHPIGLKARAQWHDRRLIANVAVTNGSNMSEGFGFYDETDKNQRPTGSIRLSYRVGSDPHELELGVSGAYGVQDQQPDVNIRQWHAGVDAHGELGDLEYAAEGVWGHAPGHTSATAGDAVCDLAPCLRYKAAYALLAWRASNTFIPYVRADWRDALHQFGAQFVYVSQLARATVGVRAEIGDAVIFKAEYTFNHELGDIPQFPDDVLTTSLVVKF